MSGFDVSLKLTLLFAGIGLERRDPPSVVYCARSLHVVGRELDDESMILSAKNASTTTTRIGKRALLKSLFTARSPASPGSVVRRDLAREDARWPGLEPYHGGYRQPRYRHGPSGSEAQRQSSGAGKLRLVERGDVRQAPVALRVVEAVADRKPVGDLEADVAAADVRLAPGRLREERAHLERRRLSRFEVPDEVREGEARVDDVLDDQDVASLDDRVEVLQDPDDARRVGACCRSSRRP